jgi:hypothetical protein
MKQTHYAKAKYHLAAMIREMRFYPDTKGKLDNLIPAAIEKALKDEARHVVSKMSGVTDITSQRNQVYQQLKSQLSG